MGAGCLPQWDVIHHCVEDACIGVRIEVHNTDKVCLGGCCAAVCQPPEVVIAEVGVVKLYEIFLSYVVFPRTAGVQEVVYPRSLTESTADASGMAVWRYGVEIRVEAHLTDFRIEQFEVW